MKCFLTMMFFVSFCASSIAQTNTFPSSGKTGIGTTTPTSQLEVVSPATAGLESLIKMRVTDAADDYLEIANTTGSNGVFIPMIMGHVNSSSTISLFLSGTTSSSNDTGTNPLTIFDSRLATGKVNNRPLFGWWSYNDRYMTMLANGNLGIGIDNPVEKLAVNGKIRAREIKVENANWPDYVFAKSYQLSTLEETEKHIRENGHLPGIPSADEVKANGIDLGEMNAKLLQKIEELTLHLIELKRESEKQNDKQAKEIEYLKSRLK